MGNAPENAGPTPATHPSANGKVFISYSRKDSIFADRIEAALGTRGFTVAIDREQIFAFEEWWKRIETLITQADTVVFVLSPDSLASKVALKEVSYAASLNKRFAPIVWRHLDNQAVPEALAKYNFIFFDDEAQFEPSADRLAKALLTDIAWIRGHTGFGEAARRWSVAGRPDGLLLRSPSLEEAEHWIAARPEGAPAPTEETRTFILQSRAAATRRRHILFVSLTFGLIVAFGLAGYSYYQRAQAQRQLAVSINNDLGLEPGLPLKPRERYALWKLAVADEPVKRDFVSILAGSPEETLRSSPGFVNISRALGLLRPSAAEAESLVTAAIGGLQLTKDRGQAAPVIGELNALSPKIAASQGVEPLLRQISQTTDPDALLVLAQGLQALPGKLSDAEASQALESLLRQIGRANDHSAREVLTEALQSLIGKLSETQSAKALELVLSQIGQTMNSPEPQGFENVFHARPLANLSETLVRKLSEAQANQALEPLLNQINQTTDPGLLQGLALALRALPTRLSEAQANQAIEQLLKQIDRTTNSDDLCTLATALGALPVTLSQAQAKRALEPLLKQVGETTNPESLRALAQALQAVPTNLSEPEASQALEPLLREIGKPRVYLAAGGETTDYLGFEQLGEAVQALAGKLSEWQGTRALEVLLKQIGQTDDDRVFRALAQPLQALPAKLSDAQATLALQPLLTRIVEIVHPQHVQALGQALQALVGKLSESQANQAIEPLLKKIGQTRDFEALLALAKGLGALPTKLSEAQANDAIEPLLSEVREMANPFAVQLMEGLQALAGTLSETQATRVVDQLFREIDREADPEQLRALAVALRALPAKLTKAQANQTIEPLLRHIGETTNPEALEAWAGILQILPVTLSQAQAKRALEPLLKQVGETTNPESLRALAQALQALARTLSDTETVQALDVASSSLAWASTDSEAADWARALVALPHPSDRDGTLSPAIAYPTAAGSATEVLLDAIRVGHPDAPAKEAGTDAALTWLAKKHSSILRPVCPEPPQRFEVSGLRCPSRDGY